MSKMPPEFEAILTAYPKIEVRRAHVLNLIQWRLERGRTFRAGEIRRACRMKTSDAYVRRVISDVLECGLAARAADGRIGPSPRHVTGFRAMLLDHVRGRGVQSRRDIRLAAPIPADGREIDAALADLVRRGALEKTGRGTYGPVHTPRSAF